MKGGIALLMPAVAKEMAGKGEDDDEAEGDSPEPTEEMAAAAGAVGRALGIDLPDAKKRDLAKALLLFKYCCEEE